MHRVTPLISDGIQELAVLNMVLRVAMVTVEVIVLNTEMTDRTLSQLCRLKDPWTIYGRVMSMMFRLSLVTKLVVTVGAGAAVMVTSF